MHLARVNETLALKKMWQRQQTVLGISNSSGSTVAGPQTGGIMSK